MARSAICNLIVIGTCLPWSFALDETVTLRKNGRRRTRYFDQRIEGSKEKLTSLASMISDEGFSSRAQSFKPDGPRRIPAYSPTPEERDLQIQEKCGITALERSRDILTELLTISEASSLSNPETSQFKAREWVDNVDEAIICSDNTDRIDQRYRLALLYYELGGSKWTRCKADQDVTASDDEEKCPGKRFLDKSDECEWYGIDCGESYNIATAEFMDAYYPLEFLDLQSNNLSGELYKEFYEFPSLKMILLNDNSLSGTIKDDIGQMKDITLLQLNSNSFDGPVPETGLLEMKQLAGLSIQGNDLQGSLDELCNVRDDRRVQFDSYLTLHMEADCAGDPPKVSCECCTKCASSNHKDKKRKGSKGRGKGAKGSKGSRKGAKGSKGR